MQFPRGVAQQAPGLNRPTPQASTSQQPVPASSAATNNANAAKRRAPLSKRGLFSKELGPMMYGFGDVPNPLPESILMMEELLVDYLAEIAAAAHKVSSNKRKMKLEDVRFALRSRQRSKQLARADELVIAAAEVKKMREIGKMQYGKLSKEGGVGGDEDEGDIGGTVPAPKAAAGKKSIANPGKRKVGRPKKNAPKD